MSYPLPVMMDNVSELRSPLTRKSTGDRSGEPPPLPYLGRSYSRAEIRERLKYFGLEARLLDNKRLTTKLAKQIAAGRTVAVLRGRSEMGPRALCHRSILADPRRSEM